MEQIIKFLKHYFWRKFGLEHRGSALIAWDQVCKPKEQEGLGVLDLQIHNKSLLLKHLHKIFSAHN